MFLIDGNRTEIYISYNLHESLHCLRSPLKTFLDFSQKKQSGKTTTPFNFWERMSSPKIILAGRPNSFQFDDKVLVLDVPVKVGRSHKEDQVLNVAGFCPKRRPLRYVSRPNPTMDTLIVKCCPGNTPCFSMRTTSFTSWTPGAAMAPSSTTSG